MPKGMEPESLKMLGYDGTRLNPRKGELRQWRDDFALAMRDQGVDAEATPRAIRGIVKKPESQVIRHIEKGDKTHKPRKSKVKALKELEVIEEIKAEINGKPPVERVWDKMILKQQRTIRGAWLGAANELKETPDPNNKNLSGDIQSFVASMPKIDTERHEIKAKLIERFSIQRENTQTIAGAGQTAVQVEIVPNPQEPKSKVLER